jgi:hypothetical protein
MVVALAACASDQVTGLRDARSQSIGIAVGHELDITLGNVGPAIWADPPQVSSTALTYLGVSVVPPYVPAGPIQQFRFRARARGVGIITFRRMQLGNMNYAIHTLPGVHSRCEPRFPSI